MKPTDTFGWLDVEEIGEALAAAHPHRDPAAIRFVELKALVTQLANFKEEPGHPVNEKILEHIQAEWIQAKSGEPDDED